MIFFSCLDARKEAKENQGVRDASQFGGVPDGGPAILRPFGYSRCTRPNFPALGRGPFLVLIKEKKQKKIKASGTPAKFGGVPDGAGHFGALRLFSMYPAKLPRPRQRAFSCLDRRKEAKEDQGVGDASQIWRGTRWGVGPIREPFGCSRCTRPNFPALGRGLLITDR